MPNNYVLLEKIVVGSAGASSVTFANIPQTGYTDLVVKMSARNTASTNNWYTLKLQFNSDTTDGNYSTRIVYGFGSTAGSGTGNRQNTGYITSAARTANTFNNLEMYIPNYAGSTNKSFSVDSVTEGNGSTVEILGMHAGLWNSTAAITQIVLAPDADNFVANSTFYLYGVAKLGTTPAIAPKATGGDIVMTDGTYWYHAFRSSGTFTPAVGLTCDALVIAGGAGGGTRAGGGGGAGGLLVYTSQSLTATGYTVTVGGGGAAAPTTPNTSSGSNGGNSQFSSLTASVGGGGGGGATISGSSGGSGGGAGNSGASGGSATSGQGNAGGGATASVGGGGGGAGSAGSGGGSNGSGGLPSSSYSSWATATGTGISGNYAGGGGGGGTSIANGGGAGAGNGGLGGFDDSRANATAATANTGSGGGGSASLTSGGNGVPASGGSGIVIVRYLVA